MIKWYNIKKEFKPSGEVLAKDKHNNMLLGFVNFDEDEYNYVCEATEGGCIMYDVEYFIPAKELLINIENERETN